MVRVADDGAGTVSFDSAKDGGAGDIEFAAFFDDGAIERAVVPLVVFAEMDAHHKGVAFELHGSASFLWSLALESWVYFTMSTSDRTTSPCCTISSSIGRKARNFSSVSTTESMIGRSWERCSAVSRWMRRFAP